MKEKIKLFVVAFSWLMGSVLGFGFMIPTLINSGNDKLLLTSFGMMGLWGVGSIVAWTLSKKWLTIINSKNIKEPIKDEQEMSDD